MRFTLFTLFPEWFHSPLSTALIGKAVESGILNFCLINPRDLTTDPHHSVDDRPYGGGPGMVMMLDPLLKSLRAQNQDDLGKILLLSASGHPFTQKMAQGLSKKAAITLICGRYEGIDDRLSRLFPMEEISVGETVFNGGETAAMSIIESVSRLIPGFMGKDASSDEESFSHGLLEYPHYTRPEIFDHQAVPDVLLSGNHAQIAKWRREQSLLRTWHIRPDLLSEAPLNSADLAFLHNYSVENGRERFGRNLICALVHYPVLLGQGKSGTTSLTNLDVHDIARISRSYGLNRFVVVTPLLDQQHLLQTLLNHWTIGAGGEANPDRAEALKLVHIASTVQDAVENVTEYFGQYPLVLGTTARNFGKKLMTLGEIRTILRDRPVLLLFGTGHGLAPEILDNCDGLLRPLRWMDTYNHFPVRSAVAITLDRLLGDLN